MKTLFWVGLVVLVLGIASFLVPIPHREREGLRAGRLAVRIETSAARRVSFFVSAVMILSGAGMMIAAKRRV